MSKELAISIDIDRDSAFRVGMAMTGRWNYILDRVVGDLSEDALWLFSEQAQRAGLHYTQDCEFPGLCIGGAVRSSDAEGNIIAFKVRLERGKRSNEPLDVSQRAACIAQGVTHAVNAEGARMRALYTACEQTAGAIAEAIGRLGDEAFDSRQYIIAEEPYAHMLSHLLHERISQRRLAAGGEDDDDGLLFWWVRIKNQAVSALQKACPHHAVHVFDRIGDAQAIVALHRKAEPDDVYHHAHKALDPREFQRVDTRPVRLIAAPARDASGTAVEFGVGDPAVLVQIAESDDASCRSASIIAVPCR